MSIQSTVLGFEPTKLALHESPTITTRLGLPPIMQQTFIFPGQVGSFFSFTFSLKGIRTGDGEMTTQRNDFN